MSDNSIFRKSFFTGTQIILVEYPGKIHKKKRIPSIYGFLCLIHGLRNPVGI